MYMLTRLRKLSIKKCWKLRELPKLRKLVALEEVEIGDFVVKKLLDMQRLMKL